MAMLRTRAVIGCGRMQLIHPGGACITLLAKPRMFFESSIQVTAIEEPNFGLLGSFNEDAPHLICDFVLKRARTGAE
jgi:hypothetical protein